MAFTITEQPEPSLGGMKNLLITLTPLSSYLVQNVLIGQTQYLPGSVYLPGVVHYTAHAGGMKNLLITSTLRSCYPVQNMVIDQTQYMLYSLLTPSLPSPDMKNTRITARVEFSIKNRRHEEGFKDNANMTSVNVFMAFPIQLTQLEWHENWKGDTELNHSDRRY